MATDEDTLLGILRLIHNLREDTNKELAAIENISAAVAAIRALLQQRLDIQQDISERISHLLDGDTDPDPDPIPIPETRRIGGPYAPWNIPVESLPTDPKSDELVAKLYSHTSGRFNINAKKWTVQIFDRAEATREFPVTLKNPSWGNLHGRTAPWNPAWRISDDGDAYCVVLSYDTGHCWEAYQTRFDGKQISCGSGRLIQEGIHPSWGKPADVFAKENGFQVSRASGFHTLAMLPTREEIEAGVIPHALPMLWQHPAKGAFVAPAIKGPGATGGSADRLPMGTRVAWDIPDQDIDAWLVSVPAGTRKGMRAIAVALREYGAIGTDHGGGSDRGAIWVEHDLTAKWGEIGFDTEAASRALDGLLPRFRNRARSVAPCVWPGGDMNRVAVYPGIQYPQGYR